jgi:hypothetical protein
MHTSPRDTGVDDLAVGFHAVHQIFGTGRIGEFARLFVDELGDDVARVGAGHLPGVHRLQRTAGARDSRTS